MSLSHNPEPGIVAAIQELQLSNENLAKSNKWLSIVMAALTVIQAVASAIAIATFLR